MIAGLLLHGGDGTVFVSQEQLLELGHFAPQQGDFALRRAAEETLRHHTASSAASVKPVET